MSTINWYGHSAFKHSSGNVNVLFDPFFTPRSTVTPVTVGDADLVLVSHDHADHVGDSIAICKRTGAKLGAIVGTAEKLAAQGLPQQQILNGIGFNVGGTVTHKGVPVTMTQAFHSSESGAPVGYIVQMPDGVTVYHAGDTGIFSGMELWGRLYDIDVALLPVGGTFTMDGAQAALACKLLGCRHAIPMHWGTFPVLAQDTGAFEQALAQQAPNCTCHTMSPGQTLEFTV